ncbi:hypothetical protein KC324_g47 [Hortaea werneckii]|nr:hypothetical protein KC324_g47 [Hortaea werneckii]
MNLSRLTMLHSAVKLLFHGKHALLVPMTCLERILFSSGMQMCGEAAAKACPKSCRERDLLFGESTCCRSVELVCSKAKKEKVASMCMCRWYISSRPG